MPTRYKVEHDAWGDTAVLIDTETGKEITSTDMMAPEDRTFGRDFAPLIDLLNNQAAEIERADYALRYHNELCDEVVEQAAEIERLREQVKRADELREKAEIMAQNALLAQIAPPEPEKNDESGA